MRADRYFIRHHLPLPSHAAAQKSNNIALHRCSSLTSMLPVTLSYHLDELLKGTALEGWADVVGLTAISVLLFAVRLIFFSSPKHDVSGKVVLVTGGGKGIGFMIAKKLALDHGCKVRCMCPWTLCLISAISGCTLGSQPGRTELGAS
jgi:hypothetical protein